MSARRSFPRPKSIIRLLGGLTLVSLLAASCSGAGGLNGNVLVIDGTGISKTQLEDHLKGAVATIKPGTETKTASGAWAGSYVAENLNALMFSTAIHDEHVARRLTPVKPSAFSIGQFTDAVGGATAFKKLPKFYVDTQISTQSEVDALYASADKANGTPKEFFKNHPEIFAETCISHILVSSPDAAKKVRSDIEAGGDFAAIAKKQSIDTGSGADGGVLPCSNVQQFVAQFAEAAKKLKIGELSQPIQTQFGFHILKVTARKNTKFADAERSLPEAMKSFTQTLIRDAVFARLNNAKIDVDSSLATLDRTGEAPQMFAPSSKVLAGPALTNLPVG